MSNRSKQLDRIEEKLDWLVLERTGGVNKTTNPSTPPPPPPKP